MTEAEIFEQCTQLLFYFMVALVSVWAFLKGLNQ